VPHAWGPLSHHLSTGHRSASNNGAAPARRRRRRQKKRPVFLPAVFHQEAAIRELRPTSTVESKLRWLFFQCRVSVDVLRRYCREACALAGNFTPEALASAFASALTGIFPAMHWSINALYCDNTLSPPPLSGPEPLSTASVKQVSQVGVWLSLANAGIATLGVASTATIAAIAKVLCLVTMVMSLNLNAFLVLAPPAVTSAHSASHKPFNASQNRARNIMFTKT